MKFVFGKDKDRPKEGVQMKNTFASKLKELRHERGMSQEQLASVCGVSVQAVSKWECEQSYPDIELLETIADTFNVTIDSLLRADADVHASVNKESADAGNNGETADAPSVDDRLLAVVAEKFGVPVDNVGRIDVHMSTGDEVIHMGADSNGERTVNADFGEGLPDDGVLRVVQFEGNRLLDVSAYDPDMRIPLLLSGVSGQENVKIEIVGGVDLVLADNSGIGVSLASGGDITVSGEPINGPVTAGGDITVSDGSMNGPVSAGGNIEVGEGIGGPVSAGGDINCTEIGGSVTAGGDIDCGEIGGSVSAGGDIDCGEIGGNASAGGDIDCGEIGGSASAGGDIDCGEIGGNASAGGDIDCGDIGGDVSAEGDVNCGDVDGDVNAGGDVGCGDVDGDVSAGGVVDCGDIGGSAESGGSISFGEVHGSSRQNKKSGRNTNRQEIDLSNIGEYVSRTVNEAMEAAFGKRRKKDEDDED